MADVPKDERHHRLVLIRHGDLNAIVRVDFAPSGQAMCNSLESDQMSRTPDEACAYSVPSAAVPETDRRSPDGHLRRRHLSVHHRLPAQSTRRFGERVGFQHAAAPDRACRRTTMNSPHSTIAPSTTVAPRRPVRRERHVLSGQDSHFDRLLSLVDYRNRCMVTECVTLNCCGSPGHDVTMLNG